MTTCLLALILSFHKSYSMHIRLPSHGAGSDGSACSASATREAPASFIASDGDQARCEYRPS